MHLLIVDDDSALLAGLRRVLAGARPLWNVALAESAADAVTYLDSHNVDVVLTDMFMPGVGGAALLEMVKERSPHTLRVISSGGFARPAALDLLTVAHRAIEKPYSASQLTSLLESSMYVADAKESSVATEGVAAAPDVDVSAMNEHARVMGPAA